MGDEAPTEGIVPHIKESKHQYIWKGDYLSQKRN